MFSERGPCSQIKSRECIGSIKFISIFRLKGYVVKSLFGGSALLLFYSVWAMASCNYIPQIMFNNVF